MNRKMLVGLFLVIMSVGGNILLDPAFCVFPPCLTKSAAYRSIVLGTDSEEVRRLLFRTGVTCIVESPSKCRVVMFSDFWRDYVVEFGPNGTVTTKRFEFRFHGRGLLGRFHL